MEEQTVGQKVDLDLSDFPKITPPTQEEADEIAKRSKAIQNIKHLADNLVKSMESYVFDLQTFDDKIKMLSSREANVREQEAELLLKQSDFYKEKEALDEQKKYMVNLNLDLKRKESELADNKKILEGIEEAKTQYEEAKAQAIKEQEKVVKLNEREDDIKEREAVITESERVDAERKKLLDVRQEKITARERQLQIQADE
jgi:chromosome segregation ATPase